MSDARSSRAGVYVAYALINLHMLRNVSALFFALIFASIFLVTFLILGDTRPNRSNNKNKNVVFPIVILILTAVYIYILAISYLNFPEFSYLESVVRIALTLPFFIIGSRLTERELLLCMKITAVVGALGALSLVYQYLFGEVLWFAESSTRNGLVRFSSILGSLTIFGTFSAVALCAAFFTLNGIKRYIIIFLILTGCILSLQKAATLNILIFVVLVMFSILKDRKFGIVIISLLGLGIAVFAASISAPAYFEAMLSTVTGSSDYVKSDDYSIYEGFIQRIWELPSVLYANYGLSGLLLGVGLAGGGGIMGFPALPMAHNFVFDMLFIGGLPFLAIYLVIYGLTFLKLAGSAQVSYTDTAAFYCFLAFCINLVGSSGLQFHPVTSSIANLIAGYYLATRNKGQLVNV